MTETVEVAVNIDGRSVEVAVDLDEETAHIQSVETDMQSEIRELVEAHISGSIKDIRSWSDDDFSEKVMVEIDVSDLNKHQKNNLFADNSLDAFYDSGYVPIAVSDVCIWFRKAGDVLDADQLE